MPTTAERRPRGRLCSCLSLLIAIVGPAGSAQAYRPFDGTDADVAEPGEFELELGPVGYLQSDQDRELVAPAIVFNYGLVRGVEIVLEAANYYALTSSTPGPRDNLLDTQLTGKIVLREGCLQEHTGLSVATELGLLLPQTGGESGLGATAAGIVTQCLGRSFTIHYNGAANLTRALNLDLFGGAILEGPKSWAIRPVAELYVEREFNVGTTYSALLGAIWPCSEKLDFDVGVRVATSTDADVDLVGTTLGDTVQTPVYEVRLGLTWRVALFDK